MKTTQPPLPSAIAETLAACKEVLAKHYGSRLQSVILFGSTARQTFHSSSDLDLLVVLKPPINYFQELYALVDLLYPLQLESSHWISVKPASQSEFAAGTTQLYRNVQQEGILL
ncbi:nucleotidyltransferase family protein [Halomicronema sp. CCY15110]|uniref:nucleotidyltransferase family protein n=1 Tax=Halomicronema sp. CCY15110 TaxID=2767773 RepID=UPI00194EB041|nr:nucleotidyltransferase domain-containing protein [Halomicronema sp. CCY15110]